ncbi:hypothetical protein HC928_18115, partial [bacterium]|nr:hypothetical protein [bacterium]
FMFAALSLMPPALLVFNALGWSLGTRHRHLRCDRLHLHRLWAGTSHPA